MTWNVFTIACNNKSLQFYKILNKLIFLLIGLTSVISSACLANNIDLTSLQNNPTNTTEEILKNGLKVIVREKPNLPIVSVQIWYKVGAAYEQASASGTSHFLEHLMFRGTTNVPEQMFAKLATRNGGKQNAYTTKDATVFYHDASKDDLELIFLLESDRMVNLNITDEIVAREKSVITEELQQDNNPIAKLADLFFMNAHLGSFYQKPILGWLADIERMSKKKLDRWYSQWYTPDNAVLVVVGDVTAKHVLKLANKYFNSINTRKYGTVEPRDEVQTSGFRQLDIQAAANNEEFVFLGYNVPSLHTAPEKWEPFALDLLAALLDGGYSTRLPKNIIRRDKVANRANCWYSPFQLNSTLFLVTASAANGISLKRLQNSILAEIQKLKKEVVNSKELDAVKRIALINTIYDRDSNFNEAFNIGSMESSYYSWHESEEYYANIKAITPEQINQVAKKYLVANRLTIGRLSDKSLAETTIGSN